MVDAVDKTEIIKGWLSLLRTSSAIKKNIDIRLRAEYDISISRFDVLSALDRSNRNGLRSGELSRQLFVSDGNTTQVMSKLIEAKLVLRRPDEKDARAIIYSLSDEGKKLFDKMSDAHSLWLQAIFGDLSADELAVLRGILDRLTSDDLVKN